MQWLDHERLGYNYRMDEMSAAVGLAQLEKLDFMIKQRKKIANMYNKYLLKYNDLIQIPQTAKNNTHTWFVYVVKIRNLPTDKAGKNINRDKIIEKLQKQGISTKSYLPSIHLFSFYKKQFGYKKGDFPISEDISNNSLALPFYIGLKENDIKYITNKLISILL